jgi:hypothetical protein
MRKIRLMPEYRTYPTWEEYDDGVADIEPSELLISDSLRNALIEWDSAYQATYNADYPPAGGFATAETQADFDRQGRELWRRLSAELDGVADVSYFSVTENRLMEQSD